jgi:hypothetical protein
MATGGLGYLLKIEMENIALTNDQESTTYD